MNRRNLEFGCAVMAIGLLAGLAGLVTSVLLDFIEHLTYHYSFGSLLDGVTASSPVRRAVGPMIGGALAGCGWWLLRRHGPVPTISEAITRRGPIPRLAMTIDSALQVLVVGSGASLGRENAPRELAVALGDLGTRRWALTATDREILLGCAAGAGLAAVYSVPIGGALFALRVVLRTWNLRAAGTALITSSLAVAVAAPLTHDRRRLDWPNPQLSYLLIAGAVLLAPLALGVGLAFNRIMTGARSRGAAHTSWLLIPGIAMAGLLVGICSHRWPELPGNGSSILEISLNSSLTLAAAAALLALKPLLTAIYLRAGAMGGLLTPALATGAAMGSLVALSVNTFTPVHLNVAAVSLACAAGVLAITQDAPVWAAIFVWELAHPPWWLLIVFTTAAVTAHRLGRLVTSAGAGQKTTV
ncbi:MAG: chloride channel protein [Mycobacterium sp.]